MPLKWLTVVLTVILVVVLSDSCQAAPFEIKHIIMVSCDSLNQEGCLSMGKENLRLLANEGSATTSCLAVKADTLEAAEASLLTGCLPEEHLFFGRKDKVTAESLFDVLVKAGKSVLVVDGSGGRLRVFSRGDKEYVQMKAEEPDREVVRKAIEAFLKTRPYFTYIYLNDLAIAMLKGSQQDYYRSLKEFDSSLGHLIRTLKEQGFYDTTAIVVTSARSTSKSDMVPLVIKAPGVKSGYQIEGAMVIDVAPTLCALMGLQGPANASGIRLWGTFAAEEKNELVLAKKGIKELQMDRTKMWKKYYELKNERDRLSRQMEAIKEERENIFNFAGQREKTIAELKDDMARSKGMFAGLVAFLLLGYLVEYRILKKKFLLFH